MRRWLGLLGWIALPFVVGLVWLNARAAEPPAIQTITIGSKNFTENRLIGEMMAQIIEGHSEIRVERMLNLGGTTVVFSALQGGEIDLYPEYTGTGWTIHLKKEEPVHDPLRVYLQVAQAFRARFELVWLQPFGFNNSYAMAMDERVARRLGVQNISDLKRHQDKLRVGVSHEFLNRADGFPGLASAYGLEIENLRGMEHGLAYAAIDSGRIDLIDTWTTDGKLLRYDVRILKDDRQFFPPYDCAPLVRAQTLARVPALQPILQKLAFRIDDETMRRLNGEVEDGRGSFAEVARRFLEDQELLQERVGGAAKTVAEAEQPEGFLAFLWSRRGQTLILVGQHLRLTAIAVFLACLVAIPMGVWLTRKPLFASPVLAFAGVIQTIPSLALLAFMVPVPGFGLGAQSAIAALFVYALLPILRNTYTGIREVDVALIEVARGMGLRDRQILTHVELPLAMRTVMAGIRTATVISIGVATLAAFIGAGGLGEPIVTGLQLNDTALILAGALPAALLALSMDFVLGLAERFLVPRGLE